MRAEKLLLQAKEYSQELVSARRYLHQNAGVGFDISPAVEYVKEQLLSMGYHPVPCGKAGIIAVAGGKRPGKVFLLRADMDALPGKEESGEKFAATNGNMHACGHDLHTAMLFGAAKLLKAHEDEIQGKVKLVFQPAEETFEGAKDMVESGVLEDPKVDGALMLHVMAGIPLPTGNIVVSSPEASAPAADYFDVTVYGKGCHGASPASGIDPITVASHILLSLQEISARELPMGEKAVITVGAFHGGAAPNAIPDNATFSGTVRTFSESTREFIKTRIQAISKGIATAFRAEVDVVFSRGCPVLYNAPDAVAFAGKYMSELLGEDRVFSESEMSDSCMSGIAGSEDFAYIAQRVPSVMLSISAGSSDEGYIYPQHHPKIVFDENVLPVGAAAYAYYAIRWLEENK